MTDLWDDNRLAAGGGGNFFKFVAPGDEISGVVEAMRIHTFAGKDGKPDQHAPVLTLDGSDVTASQADLKAKLREQRPNVGDTVRIKLVAEVPNKHGGKSKVFDVTVARGAVQPADAPF